MRTYTRITVAALMLAATLTSACGPKIITVEKETETFVCADGQRLKTDTCPPTAPVIQIVKETVREYMCADGTTRASLAECPLPANPRDCPDGQYLTASGQCQPVPVGRSNTAVIVSIVPDFTGGNTWQTLVGRGLTISWMRAWSNGYSELSDFNFTVELSSDEGTTWTSDLQTVTAALRACTIYENYPFGIYGDGTFYEGADGQVRLDFQYLSGISLIGGVQEFGVLCDTNATYVAPARGLRVSLRLNKAAPPANAGHDVYYGQLNDRRDTYGTIRPYGWVEATTTHIQRIQVGGESAIPFNLLAHGEAVSVGHVAVEACLTNAFPCPTGDRVPSMTQIRYDSDASVGSVGSPLLGVTTNGRGEITFGTQDFSLPNGTTRPTYLYVTLSQDLVVGTSFFLHVAFDQNLGIESQAFLPPLIKTLPFTTIAPN